MKSRSRRQNEALNSMYFVHVDEVNKLSLVFHSTLVVNSDAVISEEHGYGHSPKIPKNARPG